MAGLSFGTGSMSRRLDLPAIEQVDFILDRMCIVLILVKTAIHVLVMRSTWGPATLNPFPVLPLSPNPFVVTASMPGDGTAGRLAYSCKGLLWHYLPHVLFCG